MTCPQDFFSQFPQELHALLENYWQDWLVACEQQQVDPQQMPLTEAGYAWACSDFLARTAIRYPAMFLELLAAGMEAPRTLEDYRAQVDAVCERSGEDETALMRELRELRSREMLRIAWRDLQGLGELAVLLQELTDLAEAVVAGVLQHAQRLQAAINGMPQDADGESMELLTFAMGKMGGGELNFSSDIDLIFCYPEDGETPGPRKVSHSEFFVAVIRRLVKWLDETTADGFVYRVDTRLRPFGASGPLAMSFSGLEQYYQIQGRDWERYAMIKARLISGREADRLYLVAMLTPFVYRRYLDFAMLEEIREMKAMINAQMQRKRVLDNIKLGPGGIREIEFIAQTLQLIRAGREPELQQHCLLKVLRLLADKHYLSREDVDALIAAYTFLRRLENRLQMLGDKQTHVLPVDATERERITLAMGMDSWQQLRDALAPQQQAVDRIFQQLVAAEDEDEAAPASAFELFWSRAEADEALQDWLTSLDFAMDQAQLQALAHSLQSLRQSPQIKHLGSDSSRKMAALVQSLLQKLGQYAGLDAAARQQVFDRLGEILRALAGRRVYLSLLLEYPQVQQQVLRLCATSAWFSERLARYPILLDGLLGGMDQLRQPRNIAELLAAELARAGDDMEQQMERMRQFKRQQVFNVAMLDVFYQEPVEAVSDSLTALADALLAQILQLAWQAMVARHGAPGCVIDGQPYAPAMGIIAYGKLGGNELGYGSDLDIIFVHDSRGEQQHTAGDREGRRVLDNQQFFARVAQRVIHFLNTRSYSGILYEADTRLRPDGQAGLMVSSMQAFEQYQQEKAWTWEHQALIRARFVTACGEEERQEARIAPEFDRIRSQVLRRPRRREELLAEVVKMREKMRRHLAGKSTDFDIKQDAGGLVDIEFMTQAGVLLQAEHNADCIRHTATLELIGELQQSGWYQMQEAQALAGAYRYFRKLKNWQNLQCEADDSNTARHREQVTAIWQRLMPAPE